MTVFEKIKAMSLEEMAHMFAQRAACDMDCRAKAFCRPYTAGNCETAHIAMLESEVKEDASTGD